MSHDSACSRMSAARLLLGVGVVAAAAGFAPAQVIIPLEHRGTFLRTNQDSPIAPVILSLSTLGLAPGDLIRIRILGEYSYNSAGATTRNSCAVFSSSTTLLATNVQARVPGAIDAGIEFMSAPTFHGSLPTDIPQDFRTGDSVSLDRADVVVPAGATHLFIGAHDSLYGDNQDTDNDFQAEITLLCAASSGACCDTIDFNGDGLFPDNQDLVDFLAVFGGGSCSTGNCTDIDFNNDGLFPDNADLEAFFSVFGGGGC
jgi:hypothetical protein